ncbi:MAG: tyrosine-type recombinase/integrase [Dorea sp.]|nr:tyrosine-type recombinase/integrase [Dorea sp.]
MSSCRDDLVTKTLLLLPELGDEEIANVRSALTEALYEYEISERCTEIAVVDTENDKLIKKFLATKKLAGGSDETYRNRYYILHEFDQFIHKPFKDVDAVDILTWIKHIQSRVCINTSSSYLSIVGSLFSYLKKIKVIDDNPMEYVQAIKQSNTVEISFNQVEVDQLKDACKNEAERAMIELMLSTGIRCEELCDLKWDDINFTTKDIVIVEGKGRKSRIVMMDDVTRHHLKLHKVQGKYESEYVFSRQYRGEVSQKTTDAVWRNIKSIAKRAGVANAHPHRFRRTFATMKYKRGMDIRKIQLLLGHSNINTTLRYIDGDLESLRDAYKMAS